ncbi:tail fiber domain-containing protein [bacterium]|nr:tail fiber domain-containing protein [bacterium]
MRKTSPYFVLIFVFVANFILLIANCSLLNAAVPRLIPYQGKLTNTSGVGIDGTRNIQFSIFPAATGGGSLWSETHWSIPVTNGLFDVVLGSATPLNLDFSGAQYWLQISVNGDALYPRQRISAEIFAIRAMYADSVNLPANIILQGDNISLLTNDAGYITALDWDTLQTYSDTTHSHDFSEITGTATDAQVPDDITVNFAAEAGAVQWGDIVNIPPDFADGNDAAADNDWAYDTGTGLGGAIYHNGHVGIGTASPEYPLHVAGSPGGYAFYSEGDIKVASGLDFGSGFGTANQVLTADGLGNCDWQDLGAGALINMNDLGDVNTVGVGDGQVLKWMAIPGQWRPANDVGGATGADNWGTQVVQHNTSISGDGTAALPLGINWTSVKNYINTSVKINDLQDVNDAGVADANVLAWIAAANQWRPVAIGPGGLGDNWGTQIIMSDASLDGDGTAGDILSVNWDTLEAYVDTFMVLDDLQDVDIDTLGHFMVISWDDDELLWKPRIDNDADMDNELIDSIVWEPVEPITGTKFNTLRIVEHSVEWDVTIPVNNDNLTDNGISELGDVNTVGVNIGELMQWDGNNWVPVTVQEVFTAQVLSDLGDVNADVPDPGDVLEWNGVDWGPGVNIGTIVNVWQDQIGFIAPLTAGALDFKVFDAESAIGLSISDSNPPVISEWYGMYIDSRGAPASDGYGLYAFGGTYGGVAPGSEFYGIKGKATGGAKVYGIYGEGDTPGAGGEGFGVYGRGKTFGLYGYGTGINSCGIYGKVDNGFAGYFEGSVYIKGKLTFEGETTSYIQNYNSPDREELQIRARTDAYTPDNDGSGINLYGDLDDEHPGAIALLAGGLGRLIVKQDGKVAVGNQLYSRHDANEYYGAFNILNPDGIPALYIYGANASEGDIAVEHTEALQIGHWNTGTSTFIERMRIENDGFVGIGTDSPGQLLDVNGDIRIGGGNLEYDGDSEFLSVRTQSDTWYIGVQNEATAGATGFFIGLDSIEDGIFHIQHDGNFGIGTTSPGAKFEVQADPGETNVATLQVSGEDPDIYIYSTLDADHNFGLNFVDNDDGDEETGYIYFDSYENDIFIKVGDETVGKFSNSGHLTLYDQLYVENEVLLRSDGSDSDPGYSWEDDDNTGIYRDAENNMAFTCGGKDVINISDGQENTYGNGHVFFQGDDHDWSLYIDNSGHFAVDPGANGGTYAICYYGSASWGVGSDSRLKKDIECFNQSLDKIVMLNPVKFRFNHMDENEPKTVGFIAQDVQKIFPEIVRTSQDGYLSLCYDDFSVLAIQAIKELKAENDELRKEIENIKELLRSK